METLLLDVMGDPAPEVRYIMLENVGMMLFGSTCKSKDFASERIAPAILQQGLKNKIKT